MVLVLASLEILFRFSPKTEVQTPSALLFSTNRLIIADKYTKKKAILLLLHEELSLMVCCPICSFKSSSFFLHTFFDL